MVLSSRVPKINNWSVFKKPQAIRISACIYSAEQASDPLAPNARHITGPWQVRNASSLSSKVRPTRYPKSLPFSEIQQAVFGDSELKHDDQQSSQSDVPPTDTDLSSLARTLWLREIDKVRMELLRNYPQHTDSQSVVDVGAIVKKLGSGGSLEGRQRVLRVYNAVINRWLSHGRKLTPYIALQGLKYAQNAHSSQAVTFYLDRVMIEEISLNPEEISLNPEEISFNPGEIGWILSVCYQRMVTEPCPAQVLQQFLDIANILKSPIEEKMSPIDVKKLLKILGAFRLRIGTNPNGELEAAWPIIFKLVHNELNREIMNNLLVSRLKYWDTIIEDILLVARHSGVDNALYNTWLMFKVSPLMSIVESRSGNFVFFKAPLIAKFTPDAEKRPVQVNHSRSPTMSWRFEPGIPQKIIHLTVQHFIDLGQPSQAWNVIQEFNASRDMVSDATWSLLLDYPQDLATWDTGMQNVILAKYEEMVSAIESAMGLQWHGGENGWHTTLQGESPEESFFENLEVDDSLDICKERKLESVREGTEFTALKGP